jgi:hypothetical protein
MNTEQDLDSSLYGFVTSAAHQAKTELTLSLDTLVKLWEEAQKNKIEFMESPYIQKGQIVYMDFEKLRRERLGVKERGKRVFYSPDDRDFILSLLS